MSSFKETKKHFANTGALVAPDFESLEACFNNEDECDDKLKALYLDLQKAKKENDSQKSKSLKAEIKVMQDKKKACKSRLSKIYSERCNVSRRPVT